MNLKSTFSGMMEYSDQRDFLFENLPYGLIRLNRGAEIVSINAEAKRILGCPGHIITKGKTCIPLYEALQADGTAFGTNELPFELAFKTGRKITNVVMGITAPNSKDITWVRTDAIPYFGADKKNPSNVFLIINDITERIDSRKAIVESERKLSTLIDNQRGMVYRCLANKHWTMLFLSKKCREITGYEPEEIIENKKLAFADIIHPEDRQKVSEHIKKSLGLNQPYDLEYRIITLRGEIKYVSERGIAIQKNNEVTYLEGMIDDISSEIKNREALREQSIAMENSLNGFALADLDGKLSYVNKSLLKMWAYDEKKEVLGKEAHILAKHAHQAQEVIGDILNKGSWKGVLTARKKNGEFFRTRLSASLIYNDEGLPYKMMATFLDVNEQELTRSMLEFRLQMEKILSGISSRFINTSDTDKAIEDSLADIGKFSKASRAYVFLLKDDGTKLYNSHEWCAEGVNPQKSNLQDLHVSMFPWWMKKMYNDEVIRIDDVAKMPTEAINERDHLLEQDIVSLISVPMYTQKKLIGFIGFDNTSTAGFWNEESISHLQLIEGILSGALEKKKIESGLLESERKFRELFQNNTAPKLIIEPETGKILDGNHAAEKFYGWSLKELMNKKMYEINTLSPEKVLDKMKKAIEKGQLTELFEHRLKDGTIKIVNVFVTKINIGDRDVLYSIIIDVSEKQKMEQRLRLLNKAIEDSPESIFITDHKGIIEYVNPKFEKTTGYTNEEILGKNVSVLRGKPDSLVYKELWETIISGNTWTGELLNKRKNGELYWVYISIAPIRNNEESISQFVAIKTDITKEKQMMHDLVEAREKAEESNRLKTAFLSAISHELRTPLNAVLGFSEILKNYTDNSKVTRFAGLINESGQNLLEIIEDIFELAFNGYNKVKIRNIDISVLEIYTNLKQLFYKLLSTSSKSDELKLNFRANEDLLKKTIVTDRGKIVQVMTNIMKNAIKFTPEGILELGIIQRKTDELTFYIKDNGIGIPKDKQDIVFEFFRQVDDSHSRNYGGAGIGLAVSQNIARAMNASITMESEEGKGTTVYFTIPFNQREINDSSIVKRERIPDLSHFFILLIENKKENLQHLMQMLIPTGIHIHIASNGKQAINIMRENRSPNLILTNLTIPIDDEFKTLIQLSSECTDIPAIGLSFPDSEIKNNTWCRSIISWPPEKEKLYGIIEKSLIKESD